MLVLFLYAGLIFLLFSRGDSKTTDVQQKKPTKFSKTCNFFVHIEQKTNYVCPYWENSKVSSVSKLAAEQNIDMFTCPTINYCCYVVGVLDKLSEGYHRTNFWFINSPFLSYTVCFAVALYITRRQYKSSIIQLMFCEVAGRRSTANVLRSARVVLYAQCSENTVDFFSEVLLYGYLSVLQ